MHIDVPGQRCDVTRRLRHAFPMSNNGRSRVAGLDIEIPRVARLPILVRRHQPEQSPTYPTEGKVAQCHTALAAGEGWFGEWYSARGNCIPALV